MPPQPTAQQAYLAARNAMVDASQPCLMDAWPEIHVKVIRNTVYMPVEVNGVESIGVLDTGASDTIVTPELAAAAKLTPLNAAERFFGPSGAFVSHPAPAQSVRIGTISHYGALHVAVYSFAGSYGKDIGMQIGTDKLYQFDYDLDLPHEIIRPFRITNCLTVDPLWRTRSTAVALRRGSIDGQTETAYDDAALFRQVSIPVSFPGGDVNALLDTGSKRSLLSYTSARRAGLTQDQIDADPIEQAYGLNGEAFNVHVHRFDKMVIGEDVLHDVSVAIKPSFDRRDNSMILGMDYIGKHHLWLSYNTDALYIDSGEPRPLIPPLDRAHQIGGSQYPAYPDNPDNPTGHVTAACWVEADGSLTGCHTTDTAVDKVFAKATLDWLSNGAGPFMQPAYDHGKPIRQIHTWSVSFEPAEDAKTSIKVTNTGH